MEADRHRLLEIIAKAVAPPPRLTVSQWADAHRFLTAEEGAAEPGEYRTDRTPYLREIMDCLGPEHPCRRVVVMKAAQVGCTEAGTNWIGSIMDRGSGPILVVQSTQELQQRWSGTRLSRMIDTTPSLAAKVGKLGATVGARRKRGVESTKIKTFPGGYLVIGNARSASSLAQLPARFVMLDEVDRYPWALPGEGDPVDIAEKRASSHADRKVYLISTPTVKDHSRIEQEWIASDQRHWWAPCPSCGEFQILVWRQVRWSELDRPPELACYQCEHCQALIEEHQREDMVAGGEWRPSQSSSVRGYHVHSLLSTIGLTMGDVATEFIRAKGRPERLKVWVQTRRGEPWEERGQGRVDDSKLMAARHEWWQPEDAELGPGIPKGVLVLTCAVDVQESPPRLELEVIGWGAGEEHWSIDHRYIAGDGTGTQVWNDLAAYLRREFPMEGGGVKRIAATCVDTGYLAQRVYSFVARQSRSIRIWAIKGHSAAARRSQRPIWPRVPTRIKRKGIGKVDLYVLNVDAAKDQIAGWLRLTHPGPGYAHHDFRRGTDYFAQLTAEYVVTKYVGGFPVRIWKKPDKRSNEVLDLRVYNLAALEGLKALGLDLETVARTSTQKKDSPKRSLEERSRLDDGRQRRPSLRERNGRRVVRRGRARRRGSGWQSRNRN